MNDALATAPRSSYVPDGQRLTLAPHRLLPLRGDRLAVLAERHTGWFLTTPSGYQHIRRFFDAQPEFDAASDPDLLTLASTLWNAGLLLTDGRVNPATKSATQQYPSSLLLKLTGACNLHCTYCYDFAPERFGADLPLERVRETLAFLLAHRQQLAIVFHGGEPLLRFGLLKEIVDCALSEAGSADRLRFAIQTNGVLMTDEIVSFLDAHDFSVGLSLDGIDEQSNALRVFHDGRSSLAFMQRFIARHGDFVRRRCGVLAVASRASAPRIPELAVWLQSQGIYNLTVSFLDVTGLGKNIPQEKLTPEEAVSLYAGLMAMIENGSLGALAIRCLLSRIENLFTFQPRDFCHKGPCAASGDFLVLDPQGTFRTCDCVYDPYFVLAGAQEPVIQILKRAPREAVELRHTWLGEHGSSCRSCALFGLCGGTCVAKAIAQSGTPQAVDAIECALSKYLYPALLQEIASDGPQPLIRYFERHRLGSSCTLT